MIDVDARGRHEAELLRDEAARIADTEAALKSVLDGVVVVPLVTHREAPRRLAVTRHSLAVPRWIAPLAGVAAAAVVVAVLALTSRNDPQVIPPADVAVTSSTELVVQPLDPLIECELELCPSLAVSTQGTLVAYDQAANTLTWFDAEPHVVPITADLDAEHVQLEAIGPGDEAYLLAELPDTRSWELVAIDQTGAEINRAAASSPDVEPSDRGLVERSCWSGCEPSTRVLMLLEEGFDTSGMYPDMTYTTGTVTVSFRSLEWIIAWPHTLSTRSHVVPRWDGGAVLSLVPESADAPSELIELLPDGSVQRFALGDEPVHALLPDGSAVVWRDGQLVRLEPHQPAAPPTPWSPELTAQPLEVPFACDRVPRPRCPDLAVSPDGTLVALDPTAGTLTWYEEKPRVVPLTAELARRADETFLMAIGPHDVAYIGIRGSFVAVAPSGAEITRTPWRFGQPPFIATPTGLIGLKRSWSNRNMAPAMPWVDLDGNPITDPRPFPTATPTDRGIEIRFGERTWLLADEAGFRPVPLDFLPRSDGGVVIVLDTSDEVAPANNVLELLPDGTIERYSVVVDRSPRRTVLPDGSLIVEHNLQLVRLTPPARPPSAG